MENFELILFKILTDIDSAVCLLGAIMLFIRGRNNRARRMLGYTLLLWGTCSVLRTVALEASLLPLLLNPLRPVGLIGGNIFMVLLLFYPLEVLLPGWLNMKRLCALFLPDAVLTFIYIGVLLLLQEDVVQLTQFSDFFTYFHQFNVWFRLSYLILVVFYIVFLLKLIYANEMKYVQWRNDNYSDVERLDLSWMRNYAYFLVAIFSSWMLNVVFATTWNFIIHTAVAILFFSYFIYKGLFYESAYPEDFFKYINGNPLNMTVPQSEEFCSEEHCTKEGDKLENISFEEKMPSYVDTFKSWMEQEKPYLHKDFKLTDVAKVLPLNRSYLSRVLNEGLGMNFCQVVRKYRVETAKHLLKESPDLPIYMVAEQSGFSSDSIFIRAFQLEMNMTPAHYRSTVNS